MRKVKTDTKKLQDILVCPKCKLKVSRRGSILACSRNHKYKVYKKIPIMAELDAYLLVEAKAWEDEWKKGVSKKSLAAYKKNMKVYKKLGYWEETGEAAKVLPSNNDSVVLDLGCGNGTSTANIRGNLVVGVDLSDEQMARAKNLHKNRDFVVADARHLPFAANSFDMIVAINLLHHVNEPEQILSECYRVLKKNGRLYTVDPNLYNPIGYVGRGLFKLLHLKKVFPTIPQFALGDEEHQFTKTQYYDLFRNSRFENFKIIPHRIERLTFFSGVLVPAIGELPFYESMIYWSGKIGNKIAKIPPFDWICYFWMAQAIK